ncbi:mitochondrial fission factor isoform X6 [Dromiciops gliroides]|uniref:mitochondrial fission factor isoform X6 n=1 Tax=Dromiciops gliroides TaxID=33562 RepID=UPI001CC81041|nr:mitochondrial fission factor isoform X6 [Dromiciops gliroides]
MSKRTSSDTPLGRMSGAAFPSPTADMAEINRIQYEMEYTEGISQRMRVPEKLKVAPPPPDLEPGFQEGVPNASVTMQVPERIVIAGNNEDISFSRPADLDLIQSTPFKPLALKTPPRVLTLSERPLDFLDLERPIPPTPQNEDEKSHLEEESSHQQVRTAGRLKRERSMSENAVRQNGQLVRNDSMWLRSDSAPRNKISRFQSSFSAPEYTVTPSQQQARVCPPHMLPEDGSNLYSARGILSFIQSSTRRAYQQVLDVLDENRRYGLSTLDAAIEGTPDDVTVVDAASLRRQIIKLNRRLQLLEEENKERAKREMVMYSITVAFWLLNSWLWFRR